jgi:protein-tyrosine-phosphatase/predicted ATP-grasp superfamily ATP-dependent carboligase
MRNKNTKVLVLGSCTTRDYALIRGLGLAGIKVVASVEANQNSPFIKSRFVKSTIMLPDKTDADKWVKALALHLKETEYDLVIPPDDYTCHAIHNNRWLLNIATISLPDAASWDNVYHKERTFDLAKEVGIPVPKGFVLKKDQEINANFNQKLDYPVVVKPLSSKVETAEGMVWLKHQYAYNLSELIAAASNLLKFTDVSVQEYCPGVGMGIGVLAHKGETLYCFQWLRVHEPAKGGASSYRVSVSLDDKILLASKALTKKLNWTGVAMIEYRYDADTQRYWLMEVNARFWGSLPLAIASKANFPYMLYQLYVDNMRSVNIQTYKSGIFCRNIEKDLPWFIGNLKSSADKYSHHLPLKTVASEIKQVLLLRERFDELNLSDPIPGLIVVKRLFFRLLIKVYRKIKLKIMVFLLCNPVFGRVLNVRLWFYRKLLSKRPVMFVCFGNICRSPFAYHNWMDKTSGNHHAVSAGYGGKPERSSPSEAIEAAREYGVDLKLNQSQLLNEQSIKNSLLIFCMDKKNIHHILETWPNTFHKCYLLGNLGGADNEIPDPYRKDVKEFSLVYKKIDDLIDNLIHRLNFKHK